MTPTAALEFRDLMCNLLEREMFTTQRVVAALPAHGHDYRIDAKSRSAEELAWHLVSSQIWFLNSIAELKFDPERRPGKPPETLPMITAWFSERTQPTLEKIRAMTAKQLLTELEFRGAFSLPAVEFLLFAHNHAVHHRGQLSMYLRPLGARVPSIYGPSGDEAMPKPQ